MVHLDLFSGIGGFALAVDSVWGKAEHIFCDIDPFCQRVLKKNFPNASIYADIKTLKADNLGRIDLLTGGFPCQPFSQAGKRRGKEDDRFLWPEMLRIIREAKPTWIIGENVAGIINMELEQVCADLENEGYEVQPFVIPACAVNAPHRRDRVWIVAHAFSTRVWSRRGASTNQKWSTSKDRREGLRQTHGKACTGSTNTADKNAPNTNNGGTQEHEQQAAGGKQCNPDVTNSSNCNGEGQHEGQGKAQFRRSDWEQDWLPLATEFCRVDDGLLVELDGFKLTKAQHRAERLKSLGNAIVPQVAMEIMKALKSLKHE